ncbi:Lead, cadmium, zinc and mercury transporting ATPase; Copper-translocating P-type ATPase [Mycetocola reblochoni REB411]|uniref:Lead, cadmium, zinc and mercury transporting ATPase Copper-translocating P-type ATPase n=2 Tax=Mycetocola reblochoni TaxID=331618 RepID=A0A1R4K013_9MICO|nr:Lead, cadmium, zinc and mercury transporting ATPase; Copper-translocating P-type ATPase [Mycetocola reblochoni REB411]
MDRHGHEGHAGMAGMDHAGHGGHAGHAAHFRRLFWIMLALAIPTIAASSGFWMLFGAEHAVPDSLAWVSPLLGTVMYLWGGSPFLLGAKDEIVARRPGMMLLVALAITVAFLSSLASSIGLVGHELSFWWELALLVVIMLLGHWVEMAALAKTGDALESIASLLPDTADRIGPDGRTTTTVPVADLTPGDDVLVRPGGRIPADGRVMDGRAEVDESLITGESVPVTRRAGDRVVAGSISTDGALRVRVEATGEATTVAGIRALVQEAQSSTTPTQRLADRAAAWLFWFALGAAVLTAVVWLALGRPDDATIRTITVLVIACPHALGLAIPLVVAIASGQAARHGILIADRVALERMRQVTTVVFDKTGTLTAGSPRVDRIVPLDAEWSAPRVLAVAAALEHDSEHPIARAVRAEATATGVSVPDATDARSEASTGMTGFIAGVDAAIGGPRMLDDAGIAVPAEADGALLAGGTVLYVRYGDELVGLLRVVDTIRPESAEAVQTLRDDGVHVVMASGDTAAVSDTVAAELGITEVHAGLRPTDKSAMIAELQSRGEVVAMVGDGVNDAPALARADVGLAIGAGTDVAIDSAQIVLSGDDPRAIAAVRELSRRSYRIMTENLWWAAGYNLAAVPLAAGVLAPIGISMPMSLGAVLMSASTVIVALNAQRIRRSALTRSA